MASLTARQLSHEGTGPVGYDQFSFIVAIALRYIDPTRKEDKSARGDFACSKDAGPCGVSSALPEPSDALDLGGLQHGKHLVVAGRGQLIGG